MQREEANPSARVLFFPSPADVSGRIFIIIHFNRVGGRTMSANCPECEAEITLTKPLKGEIIVCPDCGVELEVISENPLVLDLAPQEEEDWGE
jgi:alpha-aminoadipate carrier protein LysW